MVLSIETNRSSSRRGIRMKNVMARFGSCSIVCISLWILVLWNYFIVTESDTVEINDDGTVHSTTTMDTATTGDNNKPESNEDMIIDTTTTTTTIAKDPNLKKMPNYDYEAYVRPDIASYYQKSVGSIQEKVPEFAGVAGKFMNLSPYKVSLYWVGMDGQPDTEPILMDELIEPWGSGGTASYPTHKFIMTDYKRPKQIICTFVVQPKICVYYCDPYVQSNNGDDNNTEPPTTMNRFEYADPGIITKGREKKLSSLWKKDRPKYDLLIANLQFGDDYTKFTNGSPWLTTYPPVPVKMFSWPTDYFGQEHIVTSSETHFIQPLPQQLNHHVSNEQMKNPPQELQEYRLPGKINITLQVVSCMPKVLRIPNFLSSTEVEHMLGIVKRLQYERSSTGGGVSSTRTSRTTWISRNTDPIINAIHRRAADVMGIHEALLRQRTRQETNITNDPAHTPKKLEQINEELQIVHYDVRQEYEPHHDFGFPPGLEDDDKLDRFLNLAIYMNNVTAGGETSFPRWRSGTTAAPLKVKPIAGNAVLFYSMTPDGNLDDTSQHAGLPVLAGEKYFVNLWVRSYL